MRTSRGQVGSQGTRELPGFGAQPRPTSPSSATPAWPEINQCFQTIWSAEDVGMSPRRKVLKMILPPTCPIPRSSESSRIGPRLLNNFRASQSGPIAATVGAPDVTKRCRNPADRIGMSTASILLDDLGYGDRACRKSGFAAPVCSQRDMELSRAIFIPALCCILARDNFVFADQCPW